MTDATYCAISAICVGKIAEPMSRSKERLVLWLVAVAVAVEAYIGDDDDASKMVWH